MQRYIRKAILATSFCTGVLASSEAWAFYQQTNLVSDLPGVAKFQDTNLVNPWGLSSGGGPIWVSDNGSGVTTLYQASGQLVEINNNPAITVEPIPAGQTNSTPTGQVHNGNASNFGGAAFIFATEDGTISSWKFPNAATTPQIATASGVYKGLAVGNSSQGATLYAANFHAGTIDTFNSNFGQATLAGHFVDPHLPPGYAPFGIQNINGTLYVTYAVQDGAKHDDVAAPGNGIVDKFDTDGNFIGRFASNGGPLNSPWGLALAPANFGEFSGDLLVGNFGDGTIDAFDLNGNFRGMLTDASGNPIVIQGLWGLLFGSGSATGGATNELFFSAGIPGPGGNVEDNGLFGALTVPEPSTLALLASGVALLALRRRRQV
jgi:uncharacterized protein (TIGR03118 family)